MKTLRYILSAGVLVSVMCVSLVACNEPEGPEQNSEGTEIQPIPVNEMSDEVADFFNDFQSLRTLGKTIFRKVNESGVIIITPTDSCVVVNSMEELPEVDCYGNPFEFPVIDFDSHMLVVGVFADKGGEHVVSQRFTVEQNIASMNITVGHRDDGDFHPAMDIPGYFWGIYPKTAITSINTNVIRNN